MSSLPPPPPPQLSWGAQPPPSVPPSGYRSGPAGGPVPPDLSGPVYNIGLTILLSIVTCGIWTFVWSYRTFEDLKAHNNDGIGGGIALVLNLFASPALMFLAPAEIERMYKRNGLASPVAPLWGLWFLLPIIGNIVWYVKVQDALNDYWRSHGSAG